MDWEKIHVLLQIAHLSNSYDRHFTWLRDAAVKEIDSMKEDSQPSAPPAPKPAPVTTTLPPAAPSTPAPTVTVPKLTPTGDK